MSKYKMDKMSKLDKMSKYKTDKMSKLNKMSKIYTKTQHINSHVKFNEYKSLRMSTKHIYVHMYILVRVQKKSQQKESHFCHLSNWVNTCRFCGFFARVRP